MTQDDDPNADRGRRTGWNRYAIATQALAAVVFAVIGVTSAVTGNYGFAVFAILLTGVAVYYTRQAWRGHLRRIPH